MQLIVWVGCPLFLRQFLYYLNIITVRYLIKIFTLIEFYEIIKIYVFLILSYKIDDYARKLFRKGCFADQDHFSAQDPYEIIPEEYRERRNHNIKFRAFKPSIVKLESDKYELHYNIVNIVNKLKSFKNLLIKKLQKNKIMAFLTLLRINI